MTVSSGSALPLDESRQRRGELPVPGEAPLEGQAQLPGRRVGASGERGIVGLREVEEPAVVPEDVLDQLRVVVEPERPDDERVEVPREEVRQVEGSRLVRLHRLPGAPGREEAVAVEAADSFGT